DPGTTTITADAGSGITDSTTLTVTAAVLESINVTPTNPSIPDGRTRQFTATGTFSDSSTMNLTNSVTWSSGTTATATISNAAGTKGLATAVNPGTTTITADAGGGITDDATLTVTAAVLDSIEVTPISPFIQIGQTQQFTATGTFSDSSTMDLTDSVTWSSDTTATATISNAAGSEGLATSVATGTTTITADAGGGKTDNTTLTVTEQLKYLYVLNEFFNDISIFSINVNDPNGRLSSVGTVSNTASGASGIAITPDNAFAYVTPGLSNDAIRGYSIGIDGTLTPTAQGSLPVTDGLTSPVIHPDGNFLFVGGRTDVKTYSIDKTTGALSFSSSMEPDTGSLIEGIALSSDGSRLFIADDTFPATPQVRSASVNASTGALTLVDSLAVSNTPRRPAVHPSLGVIYSAITAASEVAVINVSAAGNLTDSGNPLATSAEPGLSAVSPDGKFFYYVRGTFGSSTVNSASINQASGLLTAVDSETLSSEGSDVIVRPDGEYIYVTDQGGGLLQIYSVNQTTGALTPRGSETLTSGVSGMGTTN
ncbi:MAG: beta-propeller fold lactonase family protein, partial [Candidatus Eremiobacteraeota bacterium]|nr:beta-propeller fold lactonase family protein [Candidatus Eremiobacteraeota bacterium]